MRDQRPKRESVSIDATTSSNMCQIAAIAEAQNIGELRCTFYC